MPKNSSKIEQADSCRPKMVLRSCKPAGLPAKRKTRAFSTSEMSNPKRTLTERETVFTPAERTGRNNY